MIVMNDSVYRVYGKGLGADCSSKLHFNERGFAELYGVSNDPVSVKVFDTNSVLLTGSENDVYYVVGAFAKHYQHDTVTCASCVLEQGDQLVQKENYRFSIDKNGNVSDVDWSGKKVDANGFSVSGDMSKNTRDLPCGGTFDDESEDEYYDRLAKECEETSGPPELVGDLGGSYHHLDEMGWTF